MSFAGVSNSVQAAHSAVSSDAVLSVRDGLLGALSRPAAPAQSAVMPKDVVGPRVGSEESGAPDTVDDARLYLTIQAHDEAEQRREQSQRIRLMLIGVIFFGIGYLISREESYRERKRSRSTVNASGESNVGRVVEGRKVKRPRWFISHE